MKTDVNIPAGAADMNHIRRIWAALCEWDPMTKSKHIKGLSFLDRQSVKEQRPRLNSFVFDFSVKSRFYHDFKKELNNTDFVKGHAQDMLMAYLASTKGSKTKISPGETTDLFYNPNIPDEDDPDYLLYELTDAIHPSDGVTTFHGFYYWARMQETWRHDKLKALEIAKGCYAKAMLILRNSILFPFPYHEEYAFVLAINQHCKLGYSAQQIRDKILNALAPKFKPGPRPSSPTKSITIMADYQKILDIFSPGFNPECRLSTKNSRYFSDAIRNVKEQVAKDTEIDEWQFHDIFFTCRKAERFATILTAHLYNVSVSTIERAIKHRNNSRPA